MALTPHRPTGPLPIFAFYDLNVIGSRIRRRLISKMSTAVEPLDVFFPFPHLFVLDGPLFLPHLLQFGHDGAGDATRATPEQHEQAENAHQDGDHDEGEQVEGLVAVFGAQFVGVVRLPDVVEESGDDEGHHEGGEEQEQVGQEHGLLTGVRGTQRRPAHFHDGERRLIHLHDDEHGAIRWGKKIHT